MELIKPIIKVGNSAGVILPREWLNGEARVTLIRKPQNIKSDILDILELELSSIIGLYIIGSYARDEQTDKSDIDVLAITTNINKKIKKAKYEIILISKDKLDENLKENILPLLPMLKEALPVINGDLIKDYDVFHLTKANLKWHIETTLSALKLIKGSIELAKEDGKISDNIAYSLVLRLREAFIVNCLIYGKKATTRALTDLIKSISGSTEAYNAYQRSKTGVKVRKTLDVKEAEALYYYLIQEIEKQEQWIKRNG